MSVKSVIKLFTPPRGQAEATMRLLDVGLGIGKTAQKEWVLEQRLNPNVLFTFCPSSPVIGSSWYKQLNCPHWKAVAASMVSGKSLLHSDEYKKLVVDMTGYCLNDSYYLTQLGPVLSERYKGQKNLPPEFQKEWESVVQTYAGYGNALKGKVGEILFEGRVHDLEETYHRFPTVPGKAYIDRLMEVTRQNNWQLSVASSIPCIIGWSRRAEYLYVFYNMHTKKVTDTPGWNLYFKDNLSTEKPVDDSTYTDINGVEWEKTGDGPIDWKLALSKPTINWEMTRITPRLSPSARRLGAWLHEGIQKKTIDYEMWKVLERQSRIFMGYEVDFPNGVAELVDKPPDLDTNLTDKSTFDKL